MVKYMVTNYKYSDENNTVFPYEEDIEDILHDALYILIERASDKKFELKAKLSTYFYGLSKILLQTKLKKRLIELKYKDIGDYHMYKPPSPDKLGNSKNYIMKKNTNAN